MPDQFVRQLTMLHAVPRHPRKITTRELLRVLEEQGHVVTQRTVQRDLNTLAEYFPDLETDGNRDMAGWSWRRSSLKDFPSLDTPMAMTFVLAQRFLKPLMPPAILGQLQPYFDAAHRQLSALNRPGFASWSDKVRVLPRTQPLIPAAILPEVVDLIYQALLEHRQFRGRYRRRDRDVAEYVFNPLGLVVRDSVIYLVATLWDYEDPLHFALHRFLHGEQLETPATIPTGFSLDAYLSTGTFQYPADDTATIPLVMRIGEDAALHLEETPLSGDQTLTPDEPGWVRLTATVQDSQQLRWWLLGFGSQVEVLEPEELRNWFKEQVMGLAGLYA